MTSGELFLSVFKAESARHSAIDTFRKCAEEARRMANTEVSGYYGLLKFAAWCNEQAKECEK